LLLISLGPPRYNGKLLVSLAPEGQDTPILVQNAEVGVEFLFIREGFRLLARIELQDCWRVCV
jgi:hypothetical protein